MNDMSLAAKLLDILRVWIDDIIPKETKNCIRSKVAIVVSVNSDSTYNVILSEDYGEYIDVVNKKADLTAEEYKAEIDSLSIDNLFSIKNETYKVNDYVIVGYLDNKLTNAFILCKNRK
jgi:hypothetical protein